MHPTAKIGKDCKIGPNVSIGIGCEIENGVRIANAVLLHRVKVCHATYLGDCCTFGPNKSNFSPKCPAILPAAARMLSGDREA